MTIEEFASQTGYIPESTEEFASYELDRVKCNFSVERYCKVWINAHYVYKACEIRRKMRNPELGISELERLQIMLANMREAYIKTK